MCGYTERLLSGISRKTSIFPSSARSTDVAYTGNSAIQLRPSRRIRALFSWWNLCPVSFMICVEQTDFPYSVLLCSLKRESDYDCNDHIVGSFWILVLLPFALVHSLFLTVHHYRNWYGSCKGLLGSCICNDACLSCVWWRGANDDSELSFRWSRDVSAHVTLRSISVWHFSGAWMWIVVTAVCTHVLKDVARDSRITTIPVLLFLSPSQYLDQCGHECHDRVDDILVSLLQITDSPVGEGMKVTYDDKINPRIWTLLRCSVSDWYLTNSVTYGTWALDSSILLSASLGRFVICFLICYLEGCVPERDDDDGSSAYSDLRHIEHLQTLRFERVETVWVICHPDLVKTLLIHR